MRSYGVDVEELPEDRTVFLGEVKNEDVVISFEDGVASISIGSDVLRRVRTDFTFAYLNDGKVIFS